MGIRVYTIERHYVVSENEVWVPGAYDTEETARYACRFEDDFLQKLQATKNPNGIITMADLLTATPTEGKDK